MNRLTTVNIMLNDLDRLIDDSIRLSAASVDDLSFMTVSTYLSDAREKLSEIRNRLVRQVDL